VEKIFVIKSWTAAAFIANGDGVSMPEHVRK